MTPSEETEQLQNPFRVSIPNRNDEFVLAALLFFLSLGAFALFWLRGPFEDIDEVRGTPIALKIQLESATWQELTLIPGIGKTIAKRIIASRDEDGPFTKLEDLQRVRGVGPALAAEMKDFLIFEESQPVAHSGDVATASNEETASGF